MIEYIVGIDPGSLLGISIYSISENKIIHSNSVKLEYFDLNKYIDDFIKTKIKENILFIIERVQSFPMDGHKQSFSFGKNYGLLLGQIKFNYPFILINPTLWIKYFKLNSNKEEHMFTANKYVDNYLVKDHNEADAILINIFGYKYCKEDIKWPELI